MKYDISIIFPCLNEESTLDECIKTTKKVMNKTKYKYEIIISDNGSTDDSIKIAKKNKVRVVNTEVRGYGSALINGINNAKGKYSVMLDSDCSYNIYDIPNFIEELEKGYDLVVGNRFNKTSEKSSCPFIHRIGAKLLSVYSNILFHNNVKDYHCGLRAFNTKKIKDLNLTSTGMEFASDMIIKSKLNKYKISNIDTKYMKDKRVNKSHLNPLRDGYRHLKLISKLKFDNSILFRYLTTFIFIVLICFISLCISYLFNFNTHDNVKNSYSYYKDTNKVFFLNYSLKNPSYHVDYATDERMLSVSYLMNKKDVISSVIEMNYYQELQERIDLNSYIDNDNRVVSEYCRYWHGYTTLLKPLVSIFEVKTIYIIHIILFIILLITVLIKLFQYDKVLGVSFIVGLITVNTFIVPLCLEYFYVFVLMMIGILLMLKMYESKSKNIDLLFFILGILTCFFDFLTCETITLTVPLMMYVYLNIKDKNKINYKSIIKYIILWGLGYSMMYLAKWVIDYIYYGSSIATEIFKKGMFRVNDGIYNTADIISANIINSILFLFPFNLFTNNALIVVVILILIGLYNYIFYEDNKLDKLVLIIISLIPFIRFMILSSHTRVHIYFVYRALIPFSMILFMGVYRLIINVKKE